MPKLSFVAARFNVLSLTPTMWLKLNEGSGTTPQDSSGNGHHSSFINTPTWNAGPPVSLDFQSGDTDGLLISGLLGSPVAVTICAWVNADTQTSGSPRVLSIGNAAEIILISNGFGAAWFDGGFRALNYTGGSLDGTGWKHIAAVIAPGSSRQEIYLDGVSAGTSSLSAAINYAGTGVPDTYVAQVLNVLPYDGHARQVLVFPRALSTAQVLAVKKATT